MKFLHDQFQKNEHMFLKGGKLEKLYPLFEMQESFFFTPKTVTSSNVHVRDSLDSKRMMSMVILALIPCILEEAIQRVCQRGYRDGPNGVWIEP